MYIHLENNYKYNRTPTIRIAKGLMRRFRTNYREWKVKKNSRTYYIQSNANKYIHIKKYVYLWEVILSLFFRINVTERRTLKSLDTSI